MYPSFEDKGKIFTDVVRKEPTEVILLTTTQTLIKGTIHIQLDNRLKDEIDKDEPFVAITDAAILDDEGNPVYKTKFLAVNRQQIVWLFPTKEQTNPGSDV